MDEIKRMGPVLVTANIVLGIIMVMMIMAILQPGALSATMQFGLVMTLVVSSSIRYYSENDTTQFGRMGFWVNITAIISLVVCVFAFNTIFAGCALIAHLTLVIATPLIKKYYGNDKQEKHNRSSA